MSCIPCFLGPATENVEPCIAQETAKATLVDGREYLPESSGLVCTEVLLGTRTCERNLVAPISFNFSASFVMDVGIYGKDEECLGSNDEKSAAEHT